MGWNCSRRSRTTFVSVWVAHIILIEMKGLICLKNFDVASVEHDLLQLFLRYEYKISIRGWIRIDFWIRIRQNVSGEKYFRYRIPIPYLKIKKSDTVSRYRIRKLKNLIPYPDTVSYKILSQKTCSFKIAFNQHFCHFQSNEIEF
jgi:hypothetical protein